VKSVAVLSSDQFTLLADAFDAYQKATGGVLDGTTGLLKITSKQYSALKPLDFVVGDQTYSLPPNGQILPRALNTQIGGTRGSIYLIVSDLGTPSGQGLDFINGFAFLYVASLSSAVSWFGHASDFMVVVNASTPFMTLANHKLALRAHWLVILFVFRLTHPHLDFSSLTHLQTERMVLESPHRDHVSLTAFRRAG
jgi:hypothetical protein